MRVIPSRTIVLVVLSLCLCWAQNATAQSVEELFDPNTVKDVRLYINRGDLAELRERYKENVYYPADFVWGGVRVSTVGIRSRGLSSRNADKPGLHVDFNRYVTGQHFLGLKSLALDNLVTDPSMIRERVAMAFFARMGLPAPRESFARLYINDAYQGLYAIIESIDNDFAERTFKDRSGYIFERKFQGEYRSVRTIRLAPSSKVLSFA